MIYASKKNKIGAEVTLVTPEMASKWLGNTADFQRNISPSWVGILAFSSW